MKERPHFKAEVGCCAGALHLKTLAKYLLQGFSLIHHSFKKQSSDFWAALLQWDSSEIVEGEDSLPPCQELGGMKLEFFETLTLGVQLLYPSRRHRTA